MPRGRLAALALLPAGALVGHTAAYPLAGGHPESGVHGYLDIACWLVAVAVLGGLGWYALSAEGARSSPRLAGFAGAQTLLFLIQESVEGHLEGRPLADTLATPAVRWGVAVQLALGAVMVLLARAAAAGGARLRAALAGSPPQRVTQPAIPRRVPGARLWDRVASSPATERGPPRLLVFA